MSALGSGFAARERQAGPAFVLRATYDPALTEPPVSVLIPLGCLAA
jgi:hypothetical protein